MALVYSGIRCSICEHVVEDELLRASDYVATSHFIGDPQHPLWRFSDSVMHRECFLNWEHREEFVRLYNDIVGEFTAGNGTYTQMRSDGEVVRLHR